MILLDGKSVSASVRAGLSDEINRLLPAIGRAPYLAVVLVGEDPGSQVYVRNKEKACAEVGIESQTFNLPAETSQEDLENLLRKLNADPAVDGILLQMPLPGHLIPSFCLEMISPGKDVDGLHPVNQGRLAMGLPGLRPCTPAGVLTMLDHYNLSVAGKKTVVVGRSNLVGRSLALCLNSRERNATVTMCHSGTADLPAECRQADFLFVAAGQPRLITVDMVKKGAVVVDIGINRLGTGLCGDVDFDSVAPKCLAISPVPRGVGPLTITQLLANTIHAWQNASLY